MTEIDLTPITRLEYDIDAILNDHAVAEPITRIELILADIVAGNTTTVEPVTRIETYLAIISGADYPVPEPVTRIETFLAIIAGEDYEEPEAVTRLEGLLAEWVEKGSGIWKTVTGSLIHLTDALASPVQALSVAIEPLQEGSGDPSPDNVRPITGWTGCNIYHRGKNLLNSVSGNILSYSSSYRNYTFSDGVVTITGNTLMGFKCQVKPSTQYTASFVKSNTADQIAIRVREFSQEPTSWSSTGFITQSIDENNRNQLYIDGTFTTTATTTWVIVAVYRSGAPSETLTISNWQLAVGNWYGIPNPYEPYSGTTYPISWQTEAGTVYGGTLDAVNGTLTVTKATKTFDENDAWDITSGVFFINRSLTDFLIGDSYHLPYFICNKYEFQKYVSVSSNAKVDGVYTNAHNTFGKRIFVRDSNYSTVDAFKASLVNSPIVVCGELVNPITYTLTPQQISTIAGENNIWADVNGEITLTYKANA